MANEKKVTNGVFNLAKQLINDGVEIQEVKAAVIKKYMGDGRDGGTAKKYANIIVCMAKKRVNKNKTEVNISTVSPVEQQSVPLKAIKENIESKVEEILEEEIDEVEEKIDEVEEKFWGYETEKDD